MIQLIHALNVLLPVLYGYSLIAYVQFFRTKEPRAGRLASRVFLAGLLVHSSYLLIRGFHFSHFPITNAFESFSLLSLCIAVIYSIIEHRTGEGNTGMFFASIVFAFQLFSSMFMEDARYIHPLLSNPMFGIHTALTLLGISALAIGGLYGMLYLMLAKELKRRQFGKIYDRLPPLDKLEGMATYATSFGLIVLGGGILLGHLWAAKTVGTFLPMDAKILSTDLAWFIYFLCFIWVRRIGWKGMRMGHFTFWAFILFFASMIFVNFFASTFHRFQS